MKRAAAARIGIAFVAWLGVSAAVDAAADSPCQYPYRVGFRVATIAGLRVALWYPTQAMPSRHSLQRPLRRLGRCRCAARVRQAASGHLLARARWLRHPVLVLHRGTGSPRLRRCCTGSPRRGHSAPSTARPATCAASPRGAIAQAGPVDRCRVCRPPGQPRGAHRRVGRRCGVRRIRSTAGAIGAAGHSLGGYTVVGLGGGWPRWKDGRIRAVLALSPYVQPFMAQHSLGIAAGTGHVSRGGARCGRDTLA